MNDPRANLVQSVHHKLLNGARARKEDFQLTLVRFGSERLLFRLSKSEHATQFVLKGALLFMLWPDQLYRPTRDNLLGFGDPAPERLRRVFSDICTVPSVEDGLDFDASSVAAEPIRSTQEYGGVRVRILARLGNARIPLQVDVGFGDAITPAPREVTFPTLLELAPPTLRAYPLETVVAEKLEAMVRLDRSNSRMKDFDDLRTLAERAEFDESVLRQAIRATFSRRGTATGQISNVPDPAFYRDEALSQRWRSFLKVKSRDTKDLPTFEELGTQLRCFLEPLNETL